MPVIRPQKIKVRPLGNAEHYRNKGYVFEKNNEFVEVDVEDLHKKFSKKVKCICDEENCHVEFLRSFNNIKDLNLTYCRKCSPKYSMIAYFEKTGYTHPMRNPEVKEKVKQTCLKNNGVPYPAQSKEVRKKYEQTCMEKYGCKNAAQNEKVKEKQAKTNIERYGTICALSNKEIDKKARETCLKNNGVLYPSQNKEVVKKQKITVMNNYGVENYNQLPEVREKHRQNLINQFKKKNKISTSKPQIHLYKLLNGEHNKEIAQSLVVDIIVDSFAIEYDGSGHWLRIELNKDFTLEEFNKKEKEREEIILNKGYKLIRIINPKKSNRDKLPSDEIIVSTIDEIKNNMNENNLNIARWNLNDNSIIYE
jgi:very-short-patch-repair endonuclease